MADTGGNEMSGTHSGHKEPFTLAIQIRAEDIGHTEDDMRRYFEYELKCCVENFEREARERFEDWLA
jgi:hypothetical protein